MDETKLTYRRYKDGEAHRPAITDWPEHHVVSGESNKCPIYVHRTPPCQGSCPSGHDRGPSDFDHRPTMGTDSGDFAVHNYEDRSFAEIIPHDGLYLGHFAYEPMRRRTEHEITKDEVLGNFDERFSGLSEQDAVFRVDRGDSTIGRYVDTDYGKCIGCYICADVCPSGYIQMGLGG